jgi:hypothetical protein
MTAIAEQLDRRDQLEVVDPASSLRTEANWQAAIAAHREHWVKMDAMLSEVDWSDFERPDQGSYQSTAAF